MVFFAGFPWKVTSNDEMQDKIWTKLFHQKFKKQFRMRLLENLSLRHSKLLADSFTSRWKADWWQSLQNFGAAWRVDTRGRGGGFNRLCFANHRFLADRIGWQTYWSGRRWCYHPHAFHIFAQYLHQIHILSTMNDLSGHLYWLLNFNKIVDQIRIQCSWQNDFRLRPKLIVF